MIAALHAYLIGGVARYNPRDTCELETAHSLESMSTAHLGMMSGRLTSPSSERTTGTKPREIYVPDFDLHSKQSCEDMPPQRLLLCSEQPTMHTQESQLAAATVQPENDRILAQQDKGSDSGVGDERYSHEPDSSKWEYLSTTELSSSYHCGVVQRDDKGSV